MPRSKEKSAPELIKQTRSLTDKERKALKKIRKSTEQHRTDAFRGRNFMTAIVLCALFAYLAYWTDYKLLSLLFGTLSVLSFGYFVIAPFEVYKDLQKINKKLAALNAVIQRNAIEVTPITAKQVAVAKEYEAEGDLYIVERSDGTILYIWDDNDNLRKVFPCLSFEIYEEGFADLIGRQVNPLSEKVTPIAIDPKAKWAYFEKEGAPENLTCESKDFNKLVGAMSAAVKK